MKNVFLLTALCATLACQAAEPESKPTPPTIKLSKERCPTMPFPQMVKTSSTGTFHFVARFLLKADGSIEDIRVEGRGPQGLKQNIASAIAGYRCLPAEADQEIATEFRFKVE